MRTTVNLPEPLIRNAKRLASEQEITLGGVLEDALRRYLAETPPVTVPPFKLHTVRGRLVDPDLDLDRTSALDLKDDELQFSDRRQR